MADAGKLTRLQARPGFGVGRNIPPQARGWGVKKGRDRKDVIGIRWTGVLPTGQARPGGW